MPSNKIRGGAGGDIASDRADTRRTENSETFPFIHLSFRAPASNTWNENIGALVPKAAISTASHTATSFSLVIITSIPQLSPVGGNRNSLTPVSAPTSFSGATWILALVPLPVSMLPMPFSVIPASFLCCLWSLPQSALRAFTQQLPIKQVVFIFSYVVVQISGGVHPSPHPDHAINHHWYDI